MHYKYIGASLIIFALFLAADSFGVLGTFAGGGYCGGSGQPSCSAGGSATSTTTYNTSTTTTSSTASVQISLTNNFGIPSAVTLDNSAPYAGITTTFPVGSTHTISALSPLPCGFSAQTCVFQSWSDGGAQTHQIVVTASATTYLATYQVKAITINWGLSVSTVDQNGNQLQGQISIDGTVAGTGFVSTSLPIGSHTVTCGSINAYATPSAQTVFLGGTSPNPVVLGCVYIPGLLPKTTVTVNVQICARPVGGSVLCFPDTTDNVVVGGQAQLLSSSYSGTQAPGSATFTVPQNSQQSLSITSVYGNNQQTVNVGTTPVIVPTITFYNGQGFSIVGASIFGSVFGGIGGFAAEFVASLSSAFLGIIFLTRKEDED